MKYSIIIIAFFATACATERQARKYYKKHPGELAYLCEREFPRNDSVGVPEVEYVPARPNPADTVRMRTLTAEDVGKSVRYRVDTLRYGNRTRAAPDTIKITRTLYYEKPGRRIITDQLADERKSIAVLKSRIEFLRAWLWRLGIPLAGFILTTIILIILKIKS